MCLIFLKTLNDLQYITVSTLTTSVNLPYTDIRERSFNMYVYGSYLTNWKDEKLQLCGRRYSWNKVFANGEATKYVGGIKPFNERCRPLKNETHQRLKFFSRKLEEGDDVEHFIEDSLIRDKIVGGITDLNNQ